MEESTSYIPAISAFPTGENDAVEPRRSGRERNLTQRYEFPALPKGSMKRKRASVVDNDNNEKSQYAPKKRAQATATTSNSKASSKSVATNKTTQPADASAKPTIKSRFDSSSKHAGDVVDLTSDDHVATSSTKPKKRKVGKGEEKRLKR